MASFVLSAAELMSDPDNVQKVDEMWQEKKMNIISRANSAKFKGNLPDRYVEALKIYLEYEKFKKAMQWDNAFYCAHLYLNCVLDKSLHRRLKEPPYYTKQAADVLVTLEGLQDELEFCMRGIRSQIIELIRRQEEARRIEAGHKPSAPLSGTAPKRFSIEQARSALDALRIDGKKTNVKLYGMDLGEPTPRAPIPPPAYKAPPSYQEHKNAGVTSKIDRRGSLDLRTSEYRIKKVTGDGSCAFRSIAQSSANGRLSFTEESQLAADLRREAVSLLRSCAKEEMTGTGLTVEQIVLMKESNSPTYNDYVNSMSRSAYAGETEFFLLSRKLNQRLSIYQPKGNSVYEHLMTYGDANTEPIKLLWQRGATEGLNHYDAIIKA